MFTFFWILTSLKYFKGFSSLSFFNFSSLPINHQNLFSSMDFMTLFLLKFCEWLPQDHLLVTSLHILSNLQGWIVIIPRLADWHTQCPIRVLRASHTSNCSALCETAFLQSTHIYWISVDLHWATYPIWQIWLPRWNSGGLVRKNDACWDWSPSKWATFWRLGRKYFNKI